MRFLRLLLATAMLAACGGDGATDPSSITGAYDLQTVDGDPLPFVFFEIGADRLEITGGRITLNADETFSDRIEFRIIEDGVTSDNSETVTGTWEANGTDLTLTYQNGAESTVTISARTLTQVVEGITFVYRK